MIQRFRICGTPYDGGALKQEDARLQRCLSVCRQCVPGGSHRCIEGLAITWLRAKWWTPVQSSLLDAKSPHPDADHNICKILPQGNATAGPDHCSPSTYLRSALDARIKHIPGNESELSCNTLVQAAPSCWQALEITSKTRYILHTLSGKSTSVAALCLPLTGLRATKLEMSKSISSPYVDCCVRCQCSHDAPHSNIIRLPS